MGDVGEHTVATSAKPGGKIAGGFVHLHLHSEYSLLDGGNRLDKLVKRVKELGMNAVAVTDHGNLFGAASFYQICKDQGVMPILGVEAYVCPPGRARSDRNFTGVSDGGYHLVLLAENDEGWSNLLYLCSEAYLTGFYFKPRIDRELLAKHSAGLIAINGHLGSEIGDHLLSYERTKDQKHWEKAVESARWHAAAFGQKGAGPRAEGRVIDAPVSHSALGPDPSALPRFFIELQHHVRDQNSINPHLIRLAQELGLPLVCDNDSHFLKAEDHDAHDTLICISMGKNKNDPDRMRYPEELYVKSPMEMLELFEREYGEIGLEACTNTVKIAERCAGSVKLPLGVSNAPMVRVRLPEASELPKFDDALYAGDPTAWYKAYCSKFLVEPFDPSKDSTDLGVVKSEGDQALRLLAEGGYLWRYGPGDDAKSKDRRARLERELKILADKNITAYFLIVWDFVNWGRQAGIPAMARGSGVGTMVGYVLGLSNACPIEYGLLFERFTDPDRSEYPDIDIDLCQDGRASVINHVRQKYGHVAQIITFGTLKARAAVRDVCRVMEVPLQEADRLAKLIPETLHITLDEALEAEPELKKAYESDARIKQVIDNARTIEGQARHASVHAAGVIVATRPLSQIVPLYKQSGAQEHEVVTQWDGPTCEKVGLLKMDFLGLRTLSVVERAKKLIRESLSEEEIWKAVGRGAEFEKWSSGRVAEWRSEDQQVPGHAGVAAGHGPGARGLSRDQEDAPGRGVLADKPDAPGGDLDSDEHRRGIRAAQSRRTPARPSSGGGLIDGTHDGVRDRDVAGDAHALGQASGVDGRGGPDDQRLHSHTEREGPGAQGADRRSDQGTLTNPASPSSFATPPLRHFATSAPGPHPLDLDRLFYDDPRVFALFQRADTTGVFQFESGGMRRLLIEMKPDRLEDLIAANALFRPGPMDLIPDYNRRKHGQEAVPLVHPIVDEFTRPTYGVMVYQEQVMQIVHGLGGIKLRDAYSLIKNISKKKHDKIEKERPKFVDGAQKQGLDKGKAEELFELILKFAGYGFNKSHSTGYAIVAYQTAYLKTYFPNQYMAAFLTFESGAQKVSDWIQYVEDCKKVRFPVWKTGEAQKVGVEVKPPDVNLSRSDFTVVYNENEAHCASNGHVRFGMGAIKGVGEKAIHAVLRARDAGGAFTSLHEFCERVLAMGATSSGIGASGSGGASTGGSGGALLTKTTLEALIKCGAMDALAGEQGRQQRSAMVASIEGALSAAQKVALDKAAGQSGLFLGAAKPDTLGTPSLAKPQSAATANGLTKAAPWSEGETLTFEKESLGFYVSSHPLERWRPWASVFITGTTASAKIGPQDQRVVLAGLVQSVRTIVIKNGKSAGQKMAIVTFEDTLGTVEAVMFAECFSQFQHLIASDQVVFMLGRVDRSRAGAGGGGGGANARRGAQSSSDDEDGGASVPAPAVQDNQNVQIVVDRVVPIDGVPLLPGRMWLRVDADRLNGTGQETMSRVAQALTSGVPIAGAKGSTGVNGTLPDKTQTFPIDIVVDTPEARVRLEVPGTLRVLPTPPLVGELLRLLGEGTIRVVGGVAVEVPGTRPRWTGKKTG